MKILPCSPSYVYKRFKDILVKGETSSVRLFFAIISMFTAIDMFSTELIDHEYLVISKLADLRLWGTLFLVYSIALMYGVLTRSYSNLLLLLEGVNGAALWVALAVSVTVIDGAPDGTMGAALVAMWLLIKYPTHWEYDDES